MAVQSKCWALAGSFAKLTNRLRHGCSPHTAPLTSNSPVQNHSFSSYDKEVDNQPVLVPDHVINSTSGGSNCWVPHPQTGVFGPAEQSRVNYRLHSNSPAMPGSCSSSALNQTAWFREQEDVEVDL